MVIILILYVEAVYLLFFKFRVLPWNKWTRTATVTIGIIVCAGFLVFLKNGSPSSLQGTTTARVVEIAPQVSGRINAVMAERNVEVEAGSVLYTIDPTLYQSRVDNLEAALELQNMRVQQFRELAEADAGSQFQLQQAEATVEQLEAQLAGARFDLENTVVRAPTKGMVPRMFLKEGMQVSPGRAVLTFLDTSELVIGGLFQQHALRNIKVGDRATVNFPVKPGHIFETEVIIIPSAIGDSVFAATGQLHSIQGQRMVRQFPVYMALPEDFPDELRRVGMAASITIHTDMEIGLSGGVANLLQQIKASLDAIM